MRLFEGLEFFCRLAGPAGWLVLSVFLFGAGTCCAEDPPGFDPPPFTFTEYNLVSEEMDEDPTRREGGLWYRLGLWHLGYTSNGWHRVFHELTIENYHLTQGPEIAAGPVRPFIGIGLLEVPPRGFMAKDASLSGKVDAALIFPWLPNDFPVATPDQFSDTTRFPNDNGCEEHLFTMDWGRGVVGQCRVITGFDAATNNHVSVLRMIRQNPVSPEILDRIWMDYEILNAAKKTYHHLIQVAMAADKDQPVLLFEGHAEISRAIEAVSTPMIKRQLQMTFDNHERWVRRVHRANPWKE